MSDGADHVIATIDGSLKDEATSTEAMRWNPALSHARSRLALYDPVAMAGAMSPLAAQLRAMVTAWQRLGEQLVKQMAPALEVIARMGHKLTVSLMNPDALRAHRRRCPACNPPSYTRPLGRPGGYDATEYRRRVKARRRHGR